MGTLFKKVLTSIKKKQLVNDQSPCPELIDDKYRYISNWNLRNGTGIVCDSVLNMSGPHFQD